MARDGARALIHCSSESDLPNTTAIAVLLGESVATFSKDTDLIVGVDGNLASVMADAAYDTIAFCETATTRGATVVVPPTKTARVSRRRPRSRARDRHAP